MKTLGVVISGPIAFAGLTIGAIVPISEMERCLPSAIG
jgi:hypothetical protein